MKKLTYIAVAAGCFVGSGVANAVVLDSYNDPVQSFNTSVLAPPTVLVVGSTVATGADVIGDSRTVSFRVENNDASTTPSASIDIDAGDSNVLGFGKVANTAIAAIIDYSGGAFVSGIDFVANGDDTFRLNIQQLNVGIPFRLTLTDSNSVTQTVSAALPNFATNVAFDIAFSDFNLVDLTSITGLTTEFDASTTTFGVDILAESFETVNLIADPDPVPVPSGLLLMAAGLFGIRRFRK